MSPQRRPAASLALRSRDAFERLALRSVALAAHARLRRRPRTRDRVLIVRSTSYGDFACMLPFLAALAKRYGRDRTDLLILSRFGPIAEEFLPNWPGAICTVHVDRPSAFAASVRAARARLPRDAYERVLYLGHSSEEPGARLVKLSTIRAVVGASTPVAGFAVVPSVRGRAWMELEPDRRIENSVLLPFLTTGWPPNLSRCDTIDVLAFSAAERRRVAELVARARGGGRRRAVGVYIASRLARKRWGRERYAELARRLLDRGDVSICVVGGAEDRAEAEAFASGFPRDDVRVLAGETSLRESILLMGGLALVVGNDGAPMHLAAAAGTPVVSIFCNWEVAGIWEPIGARRSRSIRPARAHRDPAADDYGIDRIPVDVVADSAAELLDGAPSGDHRLLEVTDGRVTSVRDLAPFPYLD